MGIDPTLPVTSSQEPVWVSEARDCYRDAILALLQGNIAFVVGGAFAIHAHTGIWRTTKDLDIFLSADDIPRAFDALRTAGFDTDIEDPVWLAKARRGNFFVDIITAAGNASMRVDCSWIDRAISEVVLDIPCKVLGVEECLASKMFVAFRERFDGAEVVHLLKACGKNLDWARLQSLMGPHWELLYWSLVLFAYVYPAHTEAVPEEIWKDLNLRFVERVTHPNKEAPFRGSLVDPRMFAIDVDEWGERNLYKEYVDRHPAMLRIEDSLGSEK